MKRRKKGLIMGIAAIVAVALVFVGYQIYRYPEPGLAGMDGEDRQGDQCGNGSNRAA